MEGYWRAHRIKVGSENSDPTTGEEPTEGVVNWAEVKPWEDGGEDDPTRHFCQ